MLRFLPDSWFEGLMRPFLLADPSAGLYYEDGAPDWRFFALLVMVAAALVAGRFKAQASTEHRRLLLTLLVLFYVWTFSIGNGRYFMAGLLVVGPLLVVAWQWLPGSRSFRWLVLASLVAGQAWTVSNMYRPGAWNLVGWRNGPAVYVSPSPLREKPAIFVTVTAISYSILVPSFHPQSRWSNLSGQVDITAGRPEFAKARQLLDAPLPIYLVAPANQGKGEPALQPDDIMWRVIKIALREHDLEPIERRCDSVRTNLLPHGSTGNSPLGAFWLCPVRHMQRAAASDAAASRPANEMDDVFERLEAYCPRFFPPGGSVTKRHEDHWLRYYLSSDMRVFVEDAGFVTFKYFRAFSPTVAGSIEDIRQGRINFDCSKLPGRYQPPWASW